MLIVHVAKTTGAQRAASQIQNVAPGLIHVSSGVNTRVKSRVRPTPTIATHAAAPTTNARLIPCADQDVVVLPTPTEITVTAAAEAAVEAAAVATTHPPVPLPPLMPSLMMARNTLTQPPVRCNPPYPPPKAAP